MELISIVIPVYNHDEALKLSLASIAAQTYKNIEIIIVDDGSIVPISDATYQITQILEGRNEQLQNKTFFIIEHQENKGAPAARNKGFGLATGQFIIFWDADVVAEKDMLKKMHNVLTIHPEVDYVYSNFYFGDKEMPGMKFNTDKLRENNYIHSTSLIRREAIIVWDESLKRFQDWDLWLSMLEKGSEGIWIPEYLFKVLSRSDGMSSWLPSFAYKKPFNLIPGVRGKVEAYERVKEVVMKKHKII
jgi:glycosyltransferase involved in cell wall biosynthesis